MKGINFAIIAAVAMAMTACGGNTSQNSDAADTEKSGSETHAEIKTLETLSDGTVVVNTTELCRDVHGFNGPTPVLVYLKDGVVSKVEALPNEETPDYFALLGQGFLNSWDGANAADVVDLEIDACTGATYSSRAVDANVRAACSLYLHQK